MELKKKIAIDAGHGGTDAGAVYHGRREKDDVLKLAMAVGRLLTDQGMETVYTRIDDSFDTSFEKAEMANEAGADYFISLHRNTMPTPNTASGVESLVYENSKTSAILARQINSALQEVGFANLGVVERPGLVLLRNAKMPTVLVEVGFVDNEADNQFFDRNFDAIAQAIAKGVMETAAQESTAEPKFFQVQTGAFSDLGLANKQLEQLKSQGFPGFLVYENELYKVRVGAFESLDPTVLMEQNLRGFGYSTFITRSHRSD